MSAWGKSLASVSTQSGDRQQPSSPVPLSLTLWGHSSLKCHWGFSRALGELGVAGTNNTRSDCLSLSAERAQHTHAVKQAFKRLQQRHPERMVRALWKQQASVRASSKASVH